MKVRIIEEVDAGNWCVACDLDLDRIPIIGEKILLPSKSIPDGLDIHDVVDVVFREGHITEVFAKVICGQNHYNRYVRK